MSVGSNPKIKVVPVLNGTTDYSEFISFLGEFEIFSSIYSGLPLGYFEINDGKGSAIIDKFENLQIGSEIKFKIIVEEENASPAGDLDNFKLPKCVILYIESQESSDKIAGKFRIWFGHKLFLYKDMRNHAYPPLTNDALVKRVLECEDRGFKLELKDSDSVDGEAVSRYKTCESDWEFLMNKVLPTSTYKGNPMFLFSDLKGDMYFKSFTSLYQKNASVVFTPNSPDDEDEQGIKMFMASNASIKENEVMSDVKLYVGNKKLVDEVQPQFSIVDNEKSCCFGGIRSPSSVSSSEGGLSKYLPLNLGLFLADGGSSYLTVNNHSLSDAYSMVRSSFKDVDTAFKLDFQAPFSTKNYSIGDTIMIYLKKGHWANGKWLVTDLSIMTSPADKDSGEKTHLVRRITACRPTFTGSKSETTLSNIQTLYKIP